jgi:hypothetical protein
VGVPKRAFTIPSSFLGQEWGSRTYVNDKIQIEDEKSKSGISIQYVSKLILSSYIANTETARTVFLTEQYSTAKPDKQ